MLLRYRYTTTFNFSFPKIKLNMNLIMNQLRKFMADGKGRRVKEKRMRNEDEKGLYGKIKEET